MKFISLKQNSMMKILLVISLIASIFLSISSGAVKISLDLILKMILNKLRIGSYEIDPLIVDVFYQIRIPRVILAIITGSGLAISGAVIQGLFRNPLVEPGLIGISSGASFFAAIAILFEGILFSKLQINFLPIIQISAFIGAILSVILVYILSYKEGKVTTISLILSGIAMNALFGSLLGILIYLANDSQLRDITFWMIGGGFGRANWTSIIKVIPFWFIGVLILPLFSRELDSLSLGEVEAKSLGVNIEKVKSLLIILICLTVGSIVSITGIISFVGLVIPHLIRMILGAKHKTLLIYSGVLGASLCLVSDLVARIILTPSELQLGIVTSIIGTPLFIWLIQKEKIRGNI
jgi:iron complex transport system permease protein